MTIGKSSTKNIRTAHSLSKQLTQPDTRQSNHADTNESTGFERVRSREIPSLKLRVEEYRHTVTGAQHFHLASDNRENVFMVAFRTVPEDSTGVAHILEHTTLCGSEKYPVRDPFFLMIRRSLNTFMNAFTASDYTAYPFASENRQDFKNLLDIYLDAVFFPLLDPLDFAQEGHRLEFSEPDNPESELVYKGIVYNEMKGDQSSTISQLYEALKAELFPTSTYHHNSGGDPKVIPELTYEQLRQFHRTHYHPGNAIFMTFGDIPAAEHQRHFQTQALQRFKPNHEVISIAAEQPLSKPKSVRLPYAVSEDKPRQSHIVLGWKLGLNTDLKALLKCNLLSDVLLDTSASPLRFMLENTSLGSAPSPLCGLEESNYELSFFCGVEGANEQDAEAFEAAVLETLGQVAEQGVAQHQLQACLHQLELSHREIGGDGYPYGLQLMFSCLAAAIHRSDPIALLDLDGVLAELREEIKAPDFVPELIRTQLLQNPHRVRLTLYPDADLAQREQAALAATLEAKRQAMSAQESAQVVDLAAKLNERQNRQEPLHLLPKVGVNDIGDARTPPTAVRRDFTGTASVAGWPELTEYTVATNGLIYQQVTCELPGLPNEQQQLLQVYSQVVTEIGSAGRDYLQTQALQHSKTGGIGCYSSLRGDREDPDQFQARFVMSSRCLTDNAADMNQILVETFNEANFTERHRIRDLVQQLRLRRDASISNNGHGLAMTAAAANFRPVARLNHGITGLQGILNLRDLDDALTKSDQLDELLAALAIIRDQLSTQALDMAWIAEAPLADPKQMFAGWHRQIQPHESLRPQSAVDDLALHQAWLTTTQVNYCAEVFPTVPEHHADAPALAVLAGVLRNGHLHRMLREQGGAYGGGATSDQANGLFRFYSYRDPNLAETFDAFRSAISWVLSADIKFDLVEEAILGIIGSMDAPASPAGEARQHFQQVLFGRTSEQRQQFRSRVISTSVDDIKRVAEAYLTKTSATCVITHPKQKLDSRFVISEI